MPTDGLKLTRAQRNQVKRATNRINALEVREFSSSTNPDVIYRTVVLRPEGKVMCDCRGWTIKKHGQPRQCKHVHELVGNRSTWTDGEFIYLFGYDASRYHKNLNGGIYGVYRTLS